MSPLCELQENNPEDFRNCLCMNGECFQALLQLVTPVIQKQTTTIWEAISLEQRSIATLRYLATGRSLQDLKFTTGISPQALGGIIPKTCKALIYRKMISSFPAVHLSGWKLETISGTSGIFPIAEEPSMENTCGLYHLQTPDHFTSTTKVFIAS